MIKLHIRRTKTHSFRLRCMKSMIPLFNDSMVNNSRKSIPLHLRFSLIFSKDLIEIHGYDDREGGSFSLSALCL